MTDPRSAPHPLVWKWHGNFALTGWAPNSNVPVLVWAEGDSLAPRWRFSFLYGDQRFDLGYYDTHALACSACEATLRACIEVRHAAPPAPLAPPAPPARPARSPRR